MSQKILKINDKSSPPTVRQTAHVEGWKLQYDIYKHLTTLSTGSILLLITFLEKLFVKPEWKPLVIVALSFLFVSILVSFFVMNLMASQVRDVEVDERFVNRNLAAIFIALGTFSIGIVSLIVFAVKNLSTYEKIAEKIVG